MEHELTLGQAIACFIITVILFLLCAWLTTIEQASY